MSEGFEEFMARRLAASTAFVCGDVAPLHAISARTSPATIFGPAGDVVAGAEQVNAVNPRGAAHFRPGSTNAFEVEHQAAGEDLAYWVGVQHSVVHMEGHGDPVPMSLRVSEIVRREDGEWVLVHRQADQLRAEAG